MRLIMWCPNIHFVETMLSIICQFRNTSFWSTIFLVGSGHSHFVVGRMSRLKNHEIFVMVGQAVVEHPRQRSANAPQWLQTFRSSLYSSACGQITVTKRFGRMLFDNIWHFCHHLIEESGRGAASFARAAKLFEEAEKMTPGAFEFTWMASICTAFVRCFS